MLRKLMATRNDLSLLVTRLALGVVMFPHGAQKLFGWFNGPGFSNTLEGFSSHLHIPKPVAVLVILAESVGAVGLVVGFLGRFMAFSIATTMVGAVLMVHSHNGFFMNWSGKTPPAEGYEYHLLAIGMALAIMIGGSGAASLDQLLQRRRPRD